MRPASCCPFATCAGAAHGLQHQRGASLGVRGCGCLLALCMHAGVQMGDGVQGEMYGRVPCRTHHRPSDPQPPKQPAATPTNQPTDPLRPPNSTVRSYVDPSKAHVACEAAKAALAALKRGDMQVGKCFFGGVYWVGVRVRASAGKELVRVGCHLGEAWGREGQAAGAAVMQDLLINDRAVCTCSLADLPSCHHHRACRHWRRRRQQAPTCRWVGTVLGVQMRWAG